MILDSGPVGRRLALTLGLSASLAMACSDDGGDGNLVGDGLGPSVEVAFPPPVSLTDASTITVRGRASDPDGVAQISVNDQAATLEPGSETEWQATVTLEPGANEIAVLGVDSLGFANEAGPVITVEYAPNWLDVPTAVVADPGNQRALALDRVLDAVLAIDYITGVRTIISGDDVGTGARFQDPMALVHDPANNAVLVIDSGLDALVSVNLADGARSPISDAAIGAGPLLVSPKGLAADLEAGLAWVVDVDQADPQNPQSVLVQIDLTSGDRTVLADATTGERPALVDPSALVYDPVSARILLTDLDVTDPQTPFVSVVAVDPATADLTPISIDDTLSLTAPRALALDQSVMPDTVLVLDDGSDRILAVDLTDGSRSVVSEDGVSAGRNFSVPVGIALERLGDGTSRALVIDTGIDELLAVNLATGARTVLSSVSLGQGAFLSQPMALAWDAPDSSLGRALVVDPGDDALLAVDLASGDRSIISNDDVGTGEEFATPVAIALDVVMDLFGQAQAASRALVVDEGADAIIAVDLGSGARVELSGPSVGAGEPFAAPMGLIFQPGDVDAGTSDRLLVADPGLDAIVAVDLATGDRTVVSDADVGVGPILGAPQAMALEMDELGYTGRLLVADSDPPALVAVDLATGDRTLVSGDGVGDGASLEDPMAVILELTPAPDPDPEAEPTEPMPLYQPTGYALVVHRGTGSIMAINLANGRRTELYSLEIGSGPMLDRPSDISLDPRNERLLVSDENMRSVLMIDLRTSERVLVSR